jgi:AcrR family transcriptional regulator
MITTQSKKNILKAAFARFGYYGFSKTTMAEIASDCGMSAANIYRHFSGKNEIIAELATKIFSEQEAKLSQVVRGQFVSCSDKIHCLFQEALLLTHKYSTEQPKMKEMVEFICQERFDLVLAHKESKRALIEQVLREGVDQKEFYINDLFSTSLAFKRATVMFHTPLFMEMYNLETLQESCRNIVTLLLISIKVNTQDFYAKH